MSCESSPGVLAAIGNTPLVRLESLEKNGRIRLFAKLEALNPGGSAKDRSSLKMIASAIERGDISPGGMIIESTSGNMGIGLAQACSKFGLRLVCVTDERTTSVNIRIMELYGAVVHVVRKSDCVSSSFLHERIKRVKSFLEENPGSYWPNQYANTDNALAHHITMQEIVSGLGKAPDFLLCAVSTCGTLRGCVEYVKENNLDTVVIAVDSFASSIFGEPHGERLIPGLGAAISPALGQINPMPTCILVSDMDCINGCRLLLNKEAILAGGSSGGVVSAYKKFASSIPDESLCVLILADRGDRYLDSIYSDAWVVRNFGPETIEMLDQHDKQK